jgi:hypothetical protein
MKRLDPIAPRGCLLAAVLALTILAAPSVGWSQTGPTCSPENPAPFAKSLVQAWADALQNSSPEKPDPVVGKYSPTAILLPTCSKYPASGTGPLRDYFAGIPGKRGFLSYKPKVVKVEDPAAGGDCRTMIFGSGLYTFELNVNGEVKTVPARYTYVFERANESRPWLITQHHSSLVPATDAACP